MAVEMIRDRITDRINLRICCEFGYDLQCAAPYAFWLLLNGKLGTTTGPIGSSPLYYFNEKYHFEDDTCERTDNNVPDKMNPHKLDDFRQWVPPKYKDYYRNNVFKYELPILFIHNKYAPEWHRPPINYLNIQQLEFLFSKLYKRYKIIYHRPKLKESENKALLGYSFDKSESDLNTFKHFNISNLEDDKLIIKYNVTTLDSVVMLHPQYTYNEVQFMLHANSDHFISVQGGNSVIASFFEGINIIYCKRGTELVQSEYEYLYPRFSNAKIIHVENTESLYKTVEEMFLPN